MMRDDTYFHDGDAFRPERFLEKVKISSDPAAALNELNKDDSISIVYGFGRRYF